MGGTALEGFSVLHHSLDREGVECAGEAFVGRLDTLHYGHCHIVFCEIGIHLKHLACLFFGLFLGGVGSVALLPEEFRRTEEHAGAHLPAENVCPLVDEDGEIAIGVDPVLICVPDDGLRSGADDKLLFKTCVGINNDSVSVGVILKAVVGDHRTFLGEAFNVVGLAAEEALRNQKREVSVDMSGFLEHIVELTLHLFPDRISVGLDHHTAAHSALFGEIGLHDQLVIPLRVII